MHSDPSEETSLVTRTVDALTLTKQCFLEWWRHYPRKRAKLAAERAWLKIRPLPTPAFTVNAIAILETQKRDPQWLKEGGAFIPHPATYLNSGRWMDEPTDAPMLSGDDADNITALQQWIDRGEP